MARSKVWTGTEWAYEDVVGGTGAGWHNYSTTEHAVGAWIDGKTIYEKTYHYTNCVLSANIPTDLENLSSLNIDTIVNLSGMFVAGNNGETYALGDLFAGDYTTVRYVASRKYLTIITNQDLYSPLTTLDVTIQYTKAGE